MGEIGIFQVGREKFQFHPFSGLKQEMEICQQERLEREHQAACRDPNQGTGEDI